MIAFLFLLLAPPASAQQDATALLQGIADSARSVKSWQMEGSVVIEAHGPGLQLKTDMPFKYAASDATHVRMEVSGGPAPVTTVCDGDNLWTYQPNAKRAQRTPLGPAGGCPPPPVNYATLATGLASAVTGGSLTLAVNGTPAVCQVVQVTARNPVGTSVLGTPIPPSSSRSLCLDLSRQFVLREEVQSKVNNVDYTATVTFTRIERDVAIPAGTFQFEAPEGVSVSARLPHELLRPRWRAPAPRPGSFSCWRWCQRAHPDFQARTRIHGGSSQGTYRRDRSAECRD